LTHYLFGKEEEKVVQDNIIKRDTVWAITKRHVSVDTSETEVNGDTIVLITGRPALVDVVAPIHEIDSVIPHIFIDNQKPIAEIDIQQFEVIGYSPDYNIYREIALSTKEKMQHLYKYEHLFGDFISISIPVIIALVVIKRFNIYVSMCREIINIIRA
jgi:hypothetical protein